MLFNEERYLMFTEDWYARNFPDKYYTGIVFADVYGMDENDGDCWCNCFIEMRYMKNGDIIFCRDWDIGMFSMNDCIGKVTQNEYEDLFQAINEESEAQNAKNREMMCEAN